MRTLIFIILKILELIALSITYLGLTRIGWLIEQKFASDPETFIWYSPYYLINIIPVLFIPVVLFLIGIAIFYSVKWFINQNNDWSWNIYHKIQRSKKKQNVKKNNSKF